MHCCKYKSTPKYILNIYKMQVSKKKTNEWAKLEEYGDLKAIARLLGLGTQWTREILKTGKGSAEQIAAIEKYFAPRKKLVTQLSK